MERCGKRNLGRDDRAVSIIVDSTKLSVAFNNFSSSLLRSTPIGFAFVLFFKLFSYYFGMVPDIFLFVTLCTQT
jgi:hypothetical protein